MEYAEEKGCTLGINVNRQVLSTLRSDNIDEQTIFALHGRSISAVRSTEETMSIRIVSAEGDTHRPCIHAGPYAVALMICPAFTLTG